MAEQDRTLWRGGGAGNQLEGPGRTLVLLLIALSLVLIYYPTQVFVVHVFNVLLLFVFAAIIALLLNPVVDRMERLRPFRGRRFLAVLVLYVIVIGLIAAAIA